MMIVVRMCAWLEGKSRVRSDDVIKIGSNVKGALES